MLNCSNDGVVDWRSGACGVGELAWYKSRTLYELYTLSIGHLCCIMKSSK